MTSTASQSLFVFGSINKGRLASISLICILTLCLLSLPNITSSILTSTSRRQLSSPLILNPILYQILHLITSMQKILNFMIRRLTFQASTHPSPILTLVLFTTTNTFQSPTFDTNYNSVLPTSILLGSFHWLRNRARMTKVSLWWSLSLLPLLAIHMLNLLNYLGFLNQSLENPLMVWGNLNHQIIPQPILKSYTLV